MSKKKKELQINYLDLIPERSAQLRWHTDIRENGAGNRE